ncbi:MAG TPA: tetratricopeptide repeat protein, partial [Gemmataceae bacterium]|nr:tetratricopeptide repeat protein [Gemmataceae bacterium]
MAAEVLGPRSEELDEFVEAYESVRARDGDVDIANFLPPADHSLYMPVLRELVRVELEYGWRAARPCTLESYQRRFPELFHDRDCLQEITFEEYRLRRQLGDNPSLAEYEQRWGVNIEHWLSLYRGNGFSKEREQQSASHDKQSTATPCPAVGTDFLDFHLLAELGRGAFGQVYLARQRGLAGRHVVLKISTNFTGEEHTLAQLQHTNIIPIYSVHKAGTLHALCMPYLGAVTLAHVLDSLRGRQAVPHSGKVLVDTARACKSTMRKEIGVQDLESETGAPDAAHEVPGAAPVVWKQLEAFSFFQAVLWMAARLADGLAHAHERGILHRDLKPANILLADDGQPMLLDFNLSQDIKPTAAASAVYVGGTLPYMAPERLRAFQQRVATTDARSDLYSLGVILFELLTGRQPFPRRTGPMESVLEQMIQDREGPPPRLRWASKAISPAVESIVRHCLEPDPGRRYQTAGQLREDLQRQMEHRPLQYAPDRSVRERASKAIRRHPRLAVALLGLLAIALIAGLATLVGFRNSQLARLGATAEYRQYRDEIQQARLMLTTRRPTDRDQLNRGLVLAGKAMERYGVRTNPNWWEAVSIRRLPLQDQEQLREETSHLLLLLASITGRQAQNGDPARRTDEVRSALELNRLAESCCLDENTLPLLRHQRSKLSRLLDPASKPLAASAEGPSPDPANAADLYLLTQDLMEQNRPREALPLWQQAANREPKSLWAWTGLAVCYESLENHQEARACYSTCIALAPNLSWLYFKRGQAYLNTRQYAEALADIDRYMADQPEVPEAHINRAIALQGLKRDADAVADLTKAIELGTSQTRVYFIRALLRTRLGDRRGAAQDRQKGLELRPSDELSWVVRGLAQMNNGKPQAALADFNEALQLNPNSLDALQNKASVLAERLGSTAEAIPVLDRAIDLHPEFVPARAGRGVLLARLGKRGPALQDADECLRRDVQPGTLYQVAGIYAL